ncbi:MAG: carbohydrate binding family 9 domain-containing protein [Bacteroidales bacterium]|nr:carbohydrate binding family 9 domain-containing protein [Bacteroidales bacterium]
MKRLINLLLLIIICSQIQANKAAFNIAEYTANIGPSEISPTIDGIINNKEWENAYTFKNFWDHWPSDSTQSEYQTEVKITYDEDFLYLAIILDDDNSEKIIQTLKRDSENEYWNSDAFAVIIDPINSKSNGYIFGVNAGGAQFDGLIAVNGSYNSIDANWNNIWHSDLSIAEDHWEIEMAIPFSSLKFSQNTEWGINFIRNDMKRNTYSTWTKFPTNFQGIDLGHTGNIIFKDLPSASSKKFVIVPSTLGSVEKNNVDNLPISTTGNFGLDSKVAISSSLNLDITVNPDFSQVEVDQQVTNLSRFNPYFPEKRNFFLENSDLFSNLGSGEARPLFTRKIGLKDGENVPIILGTRLSGNVNENLRIGLMDVQTADKGDLSAENYAMGAIQQKVLKRSSIKAFMINRQTIENSSFSSQDFNRVAGAEFNFLSENGKMQGSAKYHKSFSPEKYSGSGYYNINSTFNSRKYYAEFDLSQMDKNYIADVGFTPRLYNYDADRDSSIRLGYKGVFTQHVLRFYPKSGFINRHQLGGSARLFYNTDNILTEYELYASYFINLKNRSWIYTRYYINMVKLPFPTTIIDSDNALPAERYDYNGFFAQYRTSANKNLSGRVYGSYGSFFNGDKLTMGTEIYFRKQPWGNFSINYQLDKVDLAANYGKQDLHLIGAKTQISFSKKLFWTTFLQYHTQAENFNINSRIQWRYKPMSDIYFVVTNNYNSYDFSQKDLMFVLKLSYWLNV